MSAACTLAQQKQQRVEIEATLSSNPVDTEKLKQLARLNDGFLSNTLRSRVWPKVLGVNRYHIPDYKRYVKVEFIDATCAYLS